MSTDTCVHVKTGGPLEVDTPVYQWFTRPLCSAIDKCKVHSLTLSARRLKPSGGPSARRRGVLPDERKFKPAPQGPLMTH
eukprot:1143328-Pelagomonas_calceolata.AAC.18